MIDALRSSGLVSEGDLRVVGELARIAGEEDPRVLAALCLALSAPGRGDVCAHLGELPALDEVPWPDFEGEWRAALQASPLIRTVTTASVSGGDGEALRPFVLEGPRLYTERYHAYETAAATALRARAAAPELVLPEPLLESWLGALFGEDREDQQRIAAELSLRGSLTVLTGGPGTGKTYTVRGMLVLLYWLQRQQERETGLPGRLRVALAAPTGKAAARMLESLRAQLGTFLDHLQGGPAEVSRKDLQAFLESLEARTLHRLLGFQMGTPTRFRHHAGNPVGYEVVIVDETSMVDLPMMAKLLDALAPSTRLILLGDADQLVSVECGSVLADLCAPGGVLEGRVARLRKSRRFSDQSGLGRFVQHAVGAGARPQEAAAMLLGSGSQDLEFLPLGEHGGLPTGVRRLLIEGFRPYLECLRRGPREGLSGVAFHRHVLGLFEGFRVLCAHRRGTLGVDGMNRLVATLLEREGLAQPYGEDWIGRPIMITENDYGVERYNGDIGVVVEVGDRDERRRVVAFPEGERGVRTLPFARLPAYREAFALTIHKSQGSEFPHVLVVLPVQESRLASRELVYTAVTRARERVTTLGTAEGIERALAVRVRRASGLRERLAQRLAQATSAQPR